ncbi:MAG: hypothetical protein RR275_09305 [Lachnospiraceae bacterium]
MKTSEQKDKERFDAKQAEMEKEKEYMDSLIVVATNGIESKTERLKAIGILKEKLPNITHMWDSISNSIIHEN